METKVMKKTKRLAGYRMDTPGALGSLATGLWEAGIKIQAFSGGVSEELIEIHLIVDKPQLARDILSELGWYVQGPTA